MLFVGERRGRYARHRRNARLQISPHRSADRFGHAHHRYRYVRRHIVPADRGAGHAVQARTIVRDEAELVRSTVEEWSANPEVDVVITSGGTGLSGRDVTIEALASRFDKVIDGFSVIFHQISYQTVGLSTLQSRAMAGLLSNTIVFCLPGSNGAVKDGWDGIIVHQLDSRYRPCNLVELMPRFSET